MGRKPKTSEPPPPSTKADVDKTLSDVESAFYNGIHDEELPEFMDHLLDPHHPVGSVIAQLEDTRPDVYFELIAAVESFEKDRHKLLLKVDLPLKALRAQVDRLP
jgi:hypothetical protein